MTGSITKKLHLLDNFFIFFSEKFFLTKSAQKKNAGHSSIAVIPTFPDKKARAERIYSFANVSYAQPLNPSPFIACVISDDIAHPDRPPPLR